MSRRLRRVIPTTMVFALVLALSAMLATPNDAGARGGFMIDDESIMDHDCLQLYGPDQASPNGIIGGDTVSLDTLVVLDVEGMVDVARIDRAQDPEAYQAAFDALVAEYAPLLDVASQSYDPLDITMNVVGFDLLQPLQADGTARERVDGAQAIIDLAKAQYGGARPAGTDIVYVLTDIDIQAAPVGYAVAGMADCIGGVTYDDRAFAVGEVSDELPFGPYTFYKDATAKIFAHEIGHLMGGHHHYQSCGTPVPGAYLGNGEVGPCSLMTNLVDFLSLPFSPVNAVVVRGHAEAYAAGNDGAHTAHDH